MQPRRGQVTESACGLDGSMQGLTAPFATRGTSERAAMENAELTGQRSRLCLPTLSVILGTSGVESMTAFLTTMAYDVVGPPPCQGGKRA